MSLLEIIAVVAILLVIVSLAFGSLTTFRETSLLDQAVDTSLGYLREARQKTLASENASAWGVHFAETSITLFRGGVYNASDATNVVYTVSSLLSLSLSISTTTASVVFDRLTGASSVTGTVTFQGTRLNRSKVIQIFSSGLSAKQ